MPLFALAPTLTAKAAQIGPDAENLRLIAQHLSDQIGALTARLEALRLQTAGEGRQALDRDLEIHHLSSRLSSLRRQGVDLCLGRMIPADGGTPIYIGRLGLTDRDGNPILIDWRAPAAEPFFAATHAEPMGLAERRRYRWAGGHIVDFWDEVFSDDPQSSAALDAHSAFIASLGRTRSAHMHDVLATIAADQDAIIRSDAHGALVVDGGPGTGKTVVALHRAAYLLYEDPHLDSRGGVLVIGPHRGYLHYVADVLPQLGEDGVAIATLADVVPEGDTAQAERDPKVARVKGSARLTDAVEAAVAFYEEPPRDGFVIETPWAEVEVMADDWVECFDAREQGASHNESRDDVWDALLDILLDRHGIDGDLTAAEVRSALAANDVLRDAFQRAWPILYPTDLVSDLYSVPAYLKRCAPWLTPDERQLLRREEGEPWTTADLPLLDAMHRRLGDPNASSIRQQRAAVEAADRAYFDDVIDNLLSANDDPESPLPLLNRASIRNALVHDDAMPNSQRNRLSGPFGHIIVDEAQELTDAEWQMVLARCPSRSVTVVGDQAQARRPFPESWEERLARVGFGEVTHRLLSINYRTPQPIMEAAAPIIQAVLPTANVPSSVRDGVPVRYETDRTAESVVTGWLEEHPTGTVAVIGDAAIAPRTRVSTLSPELAKGLEFDLVVLVAPHRWSAVDHYVAMTRATSELVIVDH